MRRVAVFVTILLGAAGLLWWLPGSSNTAAIWTSLVVGGLALGGWYLSKREDET